MLKTALVVVLITAIPRPKLDSSSLPAHVIRALPSQAPSTALVLEKLRSQDVREQAWGAFLASMYRIEEAEPHLVRLLSQNQGDLELIFHLHASVLDALIQLGVKVSPERLDRVRGFTAEVTILRLRTPRENESQLANLANDSWGHPLWLAAIHGLVSARSPHAARALLKKLVVVPLKLRVIDLQSQHFELNSDSGSIGGLVGTSLRIKVPTGFPPEPYYDLEVTKETESITVSPGPYPVYAHRGWISLNGSRACSVISKLEETDVARALLAQVAQIPLKEIPGGHASHVMKWRGEDKLRADVNRLKLDINEKYLALIKRLHDEKMLSQDESASSLRFDIQVMDSRTQREAPLPNLSDEN